MRNFRNALLGLLGAAALASASDVHELTQETFETFVSENDLVLAEFFAPWCGHCKALAPEYEEAATQLKDKNIKLAKLDCTANGDFCTKNGVEGFPTLKVYRGIDTVTVYQGQRKADAIVSYMTKQSLPAVTILSKDTIEDFKTADKVVVVAFLDKEDKALNETFTEIATSLRDDYLFGAIDDADVAKVEGVKVPGIVLYKTFDEGKNVYDGKIEKSPVVDFIAEAAKPIIGEVGPDTYTGYMTSGLPLAYIFAETEEERKKLNTELKSIAEKYKGKINFATIDATAFGQHGANLNLEVGKWPAFAIQETTKNQKYPMDQDKKVTAKTVGEYVEGYVSGEIKPSIKSEPIPEEQTGPVHVVVADSYQKEVIENDQDVLVEYYAPWCGHCKALAPKYDQLGELFKAEPDFVEKVKIAKVDATANDVPVEISGFPTIKLFRAGKKDEPVEFSGARTVEDLAKFIKEEGTHGVDAWTGHELPNEDENEKDVQEPTEEDADSDDDDTKETVKDKVKEAAEKVKEAVADGDEDIAGHDEL